MVSCKHGSCVRVCVWGGVGVGVGAMTFKDITRAFGRRMHIAEKIFDI